MRTWLRSSSKVMSRPLAAGRGTMGAGPLEKRVRTLERQLPLFPLERVVLFPGMLLPLHVFEERYKMLVGTCQLTDKLFGVVLVARGREVGDPSPRPVQVGCTTRILDVQRLTDGRMNVMTVGEHRFRLLGDPDVGTDGFLVGQTEITTVEDDPSDVPPGLVREVSARFSSYLADLTRLIGKDAAADLPISANDPVSLSFQVGGALKVHPRERQELLERNDTAGRLRLELQLLRRETQTLHLMLRAKGAEKSIGPFSVN